MIKQQIMEIGWNTEKIPLGKIIKLSILKSYEVLKSINITSEQQNGKRPYHIFHKDKSS